MAVLPDKLPFPRAKTQQRLRLLSTTVCSVGVDVVAAVSQGTDTEHILAHL